MSNIYVWGVKIPPKWSQKQNSIYVRHVDPSSFLRHFWHIERKRVKHICFIISIPRQTKF
jgi:hypothetical protein